jgi:hypothetical protein
VQVVVSVRSAQAPGVLAAVGGRPLAVVLHEGVDGDSDSGSADGAPSGPTG